MSPYSGLSAVGGANFGEGDQMRIESFAVNTQILLTAVSIGANLSALTAGHGCVWVKGALLPAP
jgi:hypothetical protein